MEPQAAIVVTTIFDSDVLESFAANLYRYGRLGQARVIVIADRRTPSAVYERCRDLSGRGFRVECPTLQEQEKFLRRVGLPPEIIPHHSDNRRNVGFLMALQSGADYVVSIDDDNYCLTTEDWLGEHAIVNAGANQSMEVDSSTSWFNIGSLLTWENFTPV